MTTALHTALSGIAALLCLLSLVLALRSGAGLDADSRWRLRGGLLLLVLVVLGLIGQGLWLQHAGGDPALAHALALLAAALLASALVAVTGGLLARLRDATVRGDAAEERLDWNRDSYLRLIRERTSTLQKEIEHADTLRSQLERHSAQMEHDLRFAAQAQAAMDTEPPQASWYQISQCSVGRELVNGDFVHTMAAWDGSLMLVVGDAMGHGAAAGFMTVMTRTALNNLNTELPPFIVLEEVNRTLAERDTGIFVTACVAKLHEDGMLYLGHAGHPPALIWRAASDSVEEVCTPGYALGMFADASISFEQDEVRLAPGDRLLLYSDGVTEALNEADQPFGRAQLEACLRAKIPVDELCATLIEAVYDHCGARPLNDDITALACEYRGAPPA